MTRHRRALAIVSLLAACVLTGCGDDEGDDQTRRGEPEKQTDCQAEVKIKGNKKAKGKWSGPGYVITGGDLGVFYKSSKGNRALSVYPENKEAETPASAVFSMGKQTYTTQGEGTLEVDPKGGGAEIKSTATANNPNKKVKIVATFEC